MEAHINSSHDGQGGWPWCKFDIYRSHSDLLQYSVWEITTVIYSPKVTYYIFPPGKEPWKPVLGNVSQASHSPPEICCHINMPSVYVTQTAIIAIWWRRGGRNMSWETGSKYSNKSSLFWHHFIITIIKLFNSGNSMCVIHSGSSYANEINIRACLLYCTEWCSWWLIPKTLLFIHVMTWLNTSLFLQCIIGTCKYADSHID